MYCIVLHFNVMDVVFYILFYCVVHIVYCVALYCILYCTGQNRIEMYRIVFLLDCTILYYTVQYYIVLHSILHCLLNCTALHCTVLCCFVLYCFVLYCIVLYCAMPTKQVENTPPPIFRPNRVKYNKLRTSSACRKLRSN